MAPPRRLNGPIGTVIFTLLLSGTGNYFLPLARVLETPFTFFGLLLVFGGILLSQLAKKQFVSKGIPTRRSFPSTKLETQGLFRYSRNPMYLGMMVTVLGADVFLGSLSPFLLFLLLFLYFHYRVIPWEERKLQKDFGKRYAEYKRKVRRWV